MRETLPTDSQTTQTNCSAVLYVLSCFARTYVCTHVGWYNNVTWGVRGVFMYGWAHYVRVSVWSVQPNRQKDGK